MPLYRRLLDAFPAPEDPAPTRVQLAEWTDELARAHMALGAARGGAGGVQARGVAGAAQSRRAAARGRPGGAALARRRHRGAPRAVRHDAAVGRPLHKLAELFKAKGATDAAWCAAAALAALNAATPEEKQLYDGPRPSRRRWICRSWPTTQPCTRPATRVRRAIWCGAAATELARSMPTDMSNGRGALVKGDNPVRRVVAAIARALGIAEPQLFLARSEPGVVAPVSGDAPGLLVGSEVPKRYSPRQQRFLYARALAHIRRGTHPVCALAPARLATVVGELVRIAAPSGTDFSRLPQGDAVLAESLARMIGPEARARLSALAARAATELPTNWEPLALGIRESAERAGLAVSGDPAAAIALVMIECQGGLEKSEVARLARFSVSEAYLSLRR